MDFLPTSIFPLDDALPVKRAVSKTQTFCQKNAHACREIDIPIQATKQGPTTPKFFDCNSVFHCSLLMIQRHIEDLMLRAKNRLYFKFYIGRPARSRNLSFQRCSLHVFQHLAIQHSSTLAFLMEDFTEPLRFVCAVVSMALLTELDNLSCLRRRGKVTLGVDLLFLSFQDCAVICHLFVSWC